MPPVQSPLAGDRKPKPKNGRTPLQPKNSNPIPKPSPDPTPVKIEPVKIELIPAPLEDKENHLHRPIVSKLVQPLIIDPSLAEELSAMRKRMERLRLDGEKTEKMLQERGKVLDLQMKELEIRGEAQMMLELEVDRLFRLKELHSYSMRVSPIRSLRDKEHEKRRTSQGYDEGGNESPSPCCSSTSSNSVSTPMAAVAVV
ncbi:hypothetical protein LINGRAHAP2_LOCUS13108 [Linum grandiflorum]